MINKERFRAKAQFYIPLNNHGLKSVVIDNETFVDFSPKFSFHLPYLINHNNLLSYHGYILFKIVKGLSHKI